MHCELFPYNQRKFQSFTTSVAQFIRYHILHINNDQFRYLTSLNMWADLPFATERADNIMKTAVSKFIFTLAETVDL